MKQSFVHVFGWKIHVLRNRWLNLCEAMYFFNIEDASRDTDSAHFLPFSVYVDACPVWVELNIANC